jgi:hypothetical protein
MLVLICFILCRTPCSGARRSDALPRSKRKSIARPRGAKAALVAVVADGDGAHRSRTQVRARLFIVD